MGGKGGREEEGSGREEEKGGKRGKGGRREIESKEGRQRLSEE